VHCAFHSPTDCSAWSREQSTVPVAPATLAISGEPDPNRLIPRLAFPE
jgi:hypothetical protein